MWKTLQHAQIDVPIAMDQLHRPAAYGAIPDAACPWRTCSPAGILQQSQITASLLTGRGVPQKSAPAQNATIAEELDSRRGPARSAITLTPAALTAV
jgi:hypothetical protein